MSRGIDFETTINVELDDYVELEAVQLLGGDGDLVDITCDTKGGITVVIAGYVIDQTDYDRLQTLDLLENEY